MPRLDWEQANRRDQLRAAPPPLRGKRRQARYQQALTAFAAKHSLRCFKCNTDNAEWAKSGISARGPWILCVPCANKRPAARPAAPIAEA